MIKFEHMEVNGWRAAIRGMRNPLNSWDKSDSEECDCYFGNRCLRDDMSEAFMCHDGFEETCIGKADMGLMLKLARAGSTHSKYRRMINVYVDITAPLYWWKEFDTYKVGTVANSCSTMHTLHKRDLTFDDFSTDDLCMAGINRMKSVIEDINSCRQASVNPELDAELRDAAWRQMIQLLPVSFNQRRTIMMNYETLANIYSTRRGHKLDEWKAFCDWIERLPYSGIITLKE